MFESTILKLSEGFDVRSRDQISWCDCYGRPSSSVIQKPLTSILDVKKGIAKLSAEDVPFRDQDYFLADELHHHYDIWENILEEYDKRAEILGYIKNGVSVFHFFSHFKGDFKGKSHDSPLPPPIFLENNKICDEYVNFICESIIDRVRNHSMSSWGKKGQCDPPYLVIPLTIEPSKPRLCHDERFLNLWMKTPEVSFDPITDVLQYVDAGHFQSKLDDKSGYDHISLTQESRTFFGLCWLDWFFVYTTLPFGWSPSSYIYHNTGLGPSHFIRSRGVPLSQYIDDRHVGQLRISQSMSDLGVTWISPMQQFT